MCTERYISPFTDFGFKRLFGSASNREFLISFLNSLFGDEDKIVDISYRNVENFGLTKDDRRAVYDLYCTTESGSHVIVEMQNAYQRYFMDRTIFYSSYPMQEVAKKGEWDYRLPKIYMVAFLNFRMPDFVETPDYKHVIRLADIKTGKVFYDKLTYIYLEMPKFDKEIEQLEDAADKWLYIIKNMNQMDSMPEEFTDEQFMRFFKMAEIEAFSREERIAYESSLKAMRDYNNTINSAREVAREQGLAEGREKGLAEGREKGLAEGREKGLKEGMEKGLKKGMEKGLAIAAKKMKEKGVDISIISSATGMSIDEVDAL